MRRPKTKRLSASAGLRPPDPLTRGSDPGPRWGLCPQTPVIGSRSRARHILVPLQNLSCPGPPWPQVLAPALHAALKIQISLQCRDVYLAR